MAYIEIPIECKSANFNPRYEDLGIEIEQETEFRPAIINIDDVIAVYPINVNECLVELRDVGAFTTSYNYEKIKALILETIKTNK